VPSVFAACRGYEGPAVKPRQAAEASLDARCGSALERRRREGGVAASPAYPEGDEAQESSGAAFPVETPVVANGFARGARP
jgi:hypothetical protein